MDKLYFKTIGFRSFFQSQSLCNMYILKTKHFIRCIALLKRITDHFAGKSRIPALAAGIGKKKKKKKKKKKDCRILVTKICLENSNISAYSLSDCRIIDLT